jgi:hypothetical protein
MNGANVVNHSIIRIRRFIYRPVECGDYIERGNRAEMYSGQQIQATLCGQLVNISQITTLVAYKYSE